MRLKQLCCIRQMMWSLCLLLSLVTFAWSEEDILEQIDQYINIVKQDWSVPGLAIAIVKDDIAVFTKGYGIREDGKDARVDQYTLFAVASNTKAFTAGILGSLVNERKLSWTDQVINYLWDFQMYDPYVTRQLNIIDLLTHRSGLPTFGGDHLWIGNSYSRQEIIRRIRFLKPNSSFRTNFQYQNLMFLVAGQLIPAITGDSWDEALKEYFFDPLAMTYSNSTIRDLNRNSNIAIPHEIVNHKLTPIEYDNLDNIAPAAAINSCVHDMAKWMRMNLNEGMFEGKQILSRNTIRKMHSIHMPKEISSFQEEHLEARFYGYGLGWKIIDYQGYKMVYHSGGMSGMISLQTLIPEEKLGIAVLTNFAPNRLPWVIAYQVIDLFLELPQNNWNDIYLNLDDMEKKRQRKTEFALLSTRIQGTKPSYKREAYLGEYINELSGIAEIRMEDNRLIFDYNTRHIGILEHWHHDVFRVHWQHPIFDMPSKTFLSFQLNEMGKIESLKVRFYDSIRFWKTLKNK